MERMKKTNEKMNEKKKGRDLEAEKREKRRTGKEVEVGVWRGKMEG